MLRRDWTRTVFLRGPDEDYTMSTKGRMLERVRVILAGRAAEEVRPSPCFTTASRSTCMLYSEASEVKKVRPLLLYVFLFIAP